jgi:hypothetical protein
MLYVGVLVGVVRVGVGEKGGGGRVKCESVSVSWLGEECVSVCVCVCVHVCLHLVQPSKLNTRRRVVDGDAHQPGSPRLFPSSVRSPSQDSLVS